jgi:predicted O-methyltransferase YrrM/DNA-binding transcriptional ArsR family regulator
MRNEIGPEGILQMAQSFMECKILHSAAELNLFEILAENPLTAGEVAGRIGLDPHALSMLLDALAAMGLLIKRNEAYLCEGAAARFLSDGPDSVLPMVRHMASLWARWSCLTDIVRGNNVEEFQFTRNHEELRAFIGAMHVVAAPMARRIVQTLDVTECRALLDVGGGSGSYTIAFLRAVPEMRATLFDLPEVIEMARERLSEEGLLGRVSLVSGSFHEQEFPAGHDLAMISAIIHSNSPEQNQDLYNKVFRSLNSGGRVLIRDYVMEPDRTYPRDGAIFAINMLVGTSGGGTYTYKEIEAGLLQAGFTGVRLLRPGEHMDAIVEGIK